jgi:pyruvate dehydrogenase E1 component alpha subunit
MAAESVDGMDVLAVGEAARRATDGIRAGHGPFFLECRTYRFRAHSMFDAELYRDKAEVDEWKRRDPIAGLRSRLGTSHLLDDATFAALETQVERDIAHAVAFAEAGTWEPVDQLTRDVYTPMPEVASGR